MLKYMVFYTVSKNLR